MQHMDEVISPTVRRVFPFITQKLVIDLVNGLSVAEELNTVNKRDSGLLARVRNGLSGVNHLRQSHLNDHIIYGVEACRMLINELCEDVQHNAAALLKINDCLQRTQHQVVQLAQLAQQLERSTRNLHRELDSVKRYNLAYMQMDALIDQWAAGGFTDLAPIGRCYAVLDALYWGAFGQYLRMDGDPQNLLTHLRHKLIIQLQADLSVTQPSSDLHREIWLRMPAAEPLRGELTEALQYQGDWCLHAPRYYLMTFMATQLPMPCATPDNIRLPNMIDVDRVATRMIDEAFNREHIS